jgi:hypothetical protein
MRKRLKKKRRSCAMCKPHKMGGATRWKPKDMDVIKRTDKEMEEAKSNR